MPPVEIHASSDERKLREKEFHDHAYARDVREPTDKFYSITRRISTDYRRTIRALAHGSVVLEYGCGEGNSAFEVDDLAAEVRGVDISPVAVEVANRHARERGVADRVIFSTMDAEALDFGDDTFDLVCGTGILHHLDVSRACMEVTRVLKPTGSAVFMEPLGHNPLINLYRRLTPQYRSPDEHPLLRSDIELIRRHFRSADVSFYQLSSIAAVPFRKQPSFDRMVRVLERADDLLFAIPGVRYQAWMCLITVAGPVKSGPYDGPRHRTESVSPLS